MCVCVVRSLCSARNVSESTRFRNRCFRRERTAFLYSSREYQSLVYGRQKWPLQVFIPRDNRSTISESLGRQKSVAIKNLSAVAAKLERSINASRQQRHYIAVPVSKKHLSSATSQPPLLILFPREERRTIARGRGNTRCRALAEFLIPRPSRGDFAGPSFVLCERRSPRLVEIPAFSRRTATLVSM